MIKLIEEISSFEELENAGFCTGWKGVEIRKYTYKGQTICYAIWHDFSCSVKCSDVFFVGENGKEHFCRSYRNQPLELRVLGISKGKLYIHVDNRYGSVYKFKLAR